MAAHEKSLLPPRRPGVVASCLPRSTMPTAPTMAAALLHTGEGRPGVGTYARVERTVWIAVVGQERADG